MERDPSIIVEGRSDDSVALGSEDETDDVTVDDQVYITLVGESRGIHLHNSISVIRG